MDRLQEICRSYLLSMKKVADKFGLGKSYRQCNDDGTFDNIKKLRHVGIYSKVSALLFKSKK